MDLTDVLEESNRWVKMKNFDYPVIVDETTHKTIKTSRGVLTKPSQMSMVPVILSMVPVIWSMVL